MKIYSTSFLTLLVIIAGLVVIFLIFPQYQNYKILNRELSLKEEEISSRNEYFNSVHSAKQMLDNKKEGLSKIDNALPLGPDPVLILLSIQKEASDNGMVLTKINSLDVENDSKKEMKSISLEEENSLGKIKVDLSLSGSYGSIINFISSLERNSRIINIDEMKISSNKEGGDSMSLEIKVEAYFKKM